VNLNTFSLVYLRGNSSHASGEFEYLSVIYFHHVHNKLLAHCLFITSCLVQHAHRHTIKHFCDDRNILPRMFLFSVDLPFIINQ
jgi:hypothetical protein